jgi:hypothetical protein
MLRRAPVIHCKRPSVGLPSGLRDQVPVAFQRPGRVAAAVQKDQHPHRIRAAGQGPFRWHAARIAGRDRNIRGNGVASAERVQTLAALYKPGRKRDGLQQSAYRVHLGVRHRLLLATGSARA